MKIVLTSPFNPGDSDKGSTYPHCFIVAIRDAPNGQSMSFDYEYGTATNVTVPNIPGAGLAGATGSVTVYTWVKGIGANTRTATISGTPYLTITNSSPLLSTDTAYGMITRQLYQYLLTNSLVTGAISSP